VNRLVFSFDCSTSSDEVNGSQTDRKMTTLQSHAHHYVPRWYQKRFLKIGQFDCFYLQLKPDTIRHHGIKHKKRSVFRRGPGACFYEDDLYALKFGQSTTDEIEKHFFGKIDVLGLQAVAMFNDYGGFAKVSPGNFGSLSMYMGAQRFRTPRGLDYLRLLTNSSDRNATLKMLQTHFQAYTTMWYEGIWEIVGAHHSRTKFIVSDNPVTFFNAGTFPHLYLYPTDVKLEDVGTRTIFPLSLNACLIITHVQLARNPHANPHRTRSNARQFAQTMKYALETQFGRELTEDEVLRINYILKRRAARYIAAAEEEWLYPERFVSERKWPLLDDNWFLMPHLYKVSFGGGIKVGYKDGSTWTMDEYGRTPNHPEYKSKSQHDNEWKTFHQAKKEWAKKRKGCSLAHIEKFGGHDEVHDRMMQDDLEKM
jgi:hypothetical protein